LINEKKAFALLAYYGSSPTTEAMNTVFGPAKVPLVGTISGAGSLREAISANPNARYMFNVRASYADETEAHRQSTRFAGFEEYCRVLPE
jgi:branched-chain amino acid transport system substrate-binding protein